ncbi:MAG: hypothetical protein P1U80_13630 [Pseudomonadales bacterium]|nr:hypothetical protein [Pseudomonadales bacterium]
MDPRLQHYLDNILPYRLYALSTFRLFLSFVEAYPEGGTFECSVDGQAKIQGKSTALTNPSIEMGIVHSRVLLEFLGLKLNKSNKLGQSTPRKTDITIRDFELPLVTREQALAPCNGDKAKAEQGFVHVITAANKLVAHSTETIGMGQEAINSYLMCSRAIPVLLNLHFYQPLGLPMPDIELDSEPAAPNK